MKFRCTFNPTVSLFFCPLRVADERRQLKTHTSAMSTLVGLALALHWISLRFFMWQALGESRVIVWESLSLTHRKCFMNYSVCRVTVYLWQIILVFRRSLAVVRRSDRVKFLESLCQLPSNSASCHILYSVCRRDTRSITCSIFRMRDTLIPPRTGTGCELQRLWASNLLDWYILSWADHNHARVKYTQAFSFIDFSSIFSCSVLCNKLIAVIKI